MGSVWSVNLTFSLTQLPRCAKREQLIYPSVRNTMLKKRSASNVSKTLHWLMTILTKNVSKKLSDAKIMTSGLKSARCVNTNFT